MVGYFDTYVNNNNYFVHGLIAKQIAGAKTYLEKTNGEREGALGSNLRPSDQESRALPTESAPPPPHTHTPFPPLAPSGVEDGMVVGYGQGRNILKHPAHPVLVDYALHQSPQV